MERELKFQVMPPLSDSEYESLKASIAEKGVIVPIVFDEDGNVIEGHHRLQVCEELGIEDFPYETREGLSEEEKVLLAYQLNTNRRHLTPDQMQSLVADVLHRFPQKSNREIARLLGISHPTVAKYRKQLEAMGQVVKLTTREGADGKEYPVSDHDEDLLGKKSFTCCICGTEHPALYLRHRNGKVVNHWGYDPWPLQMKGECCQWCNEKLFDIRMSIPEETANEHYFGPDWRDVLECAAIAKDMLHKRGYVSVWDYRDEYTEVFEGLLSTRGIGYDDISGYYKAFSHSTAKVRQQLQMDVYDATLPPNDIEERCGPHWREVLEVTESMQDDGWAFALCNSKENTCTYNEWSSEFDRRLREMGINDLWH